VRTLDRLHVQVADTYTHTRQALRGRPPSDATRIRSVPSFSMIVQYWLLASGHARREHRPVRLYWLRQKVCVCVLRSHRTRCQRQPRKKHRPRNHKKGARAVGTYLALKEQKPLLSKGQSTASCCIAGEDTRRRGGGGEQHRAHSPAVLPASTSSTTTLDSNNIP